jgi:hypothetical protein
VNNVDQREGEFGMKYPKRCPFCNSVMDVKKDDKDLFTCSSRECVLDGWLSRVAIATIKEALPKKKMGRMVQIDDFIKELQATRERFGNTCVYIRDVSWGAVALNRRADDENLERFFARK